MNIKELKELLKQWGETYEDIEVYKYTGKNHIIHTDTINALEEWNNNNYVEDYELMTEEEYQNTIYANASNTADFKEWYGDKNAKVLVIITDEFIVETAEVKYNKNGKYDYTIWNDYDTFETEREAKEYIMKNLKKNYEFYLYNSYESAKIHDHYEVFISNEILNSLSKKED